MKSLLSSEIIKSEKIIGPRAKISEIFIGDNPFERIIVRFPSLLKRPSDIKAPNKQDP
jgi:hypothetical protein